MWYLTNYIETICIEICKPNSQSFTVYRTLSGSQYFITILEILIQSTDDEMKEIIVFGDLNCDLMKEKFRLTNKEIDMFI